MRRLLTATAMAISSFSFGIETAFGQGITPIQPDSPQTERPRFPADSEPLPTSPIPKTPPTLQPPGKARTAEQLVKIKFQADTQRIVPGQSFLLAFIFEIEPGWHIYWKNSGASGGPTEIEASGPPGFTIGKMIFPRPLAIKDEEGEIYGYENKAVLYVEVTAPPDLKAGQAIFNAKINWFVCKGVCMIGSTSRMITIATGGGSVPSALPDSENSPDPAVSQFKKRIPKPFAGLSGAQSEFKDSLLTVTLPKQGKSTAMFFPEVTPGATYGDATVKIEGDKLIMTIPVTVNPNNSLGKAMKIAGLIGLGSDLDDPCYEIEIPLSAT